jgi:hypothetical protein
MQLTFRPIKVWPEEWDRSRPPWQTKFSASYSSTLRLLDRELGCLRASEAVLQVDVDAGRIRMDGQLAAGAKIDYPGVILTFDTKDHGTLTYSCNRFGGQAWSDRAGWQENLRAIALGLEALRKVERYGIGTRGEQYRGYAELPSGVELGAAMTLEDAAEYLVTSSGLPHWQGPAVGEVLERPGEFVDALFKMGAKRLHPDQGGAVGAFHRLVQARDLLLAA